MDREVFKIKEKMGMDDLIEQNPKYMDSEKRTDLCYNLNVLFGHVYNESIKDNIDKELVLSSIAKAMVEILDAFVYINILPDRLLSDIKKVKEEKHRKKLKLDVSKNANDSLHLTNYWNKIRNDIYSKRKYKPIDVNDNFIELVSFYSAFGLDYKNSELLNSKSYLDKFYSCCYNDIMSLSNSDYTNEDAEIMANLLFKCMEFFVEVGVNPKEYVDAVMEERLNKHHQK